MSKFRSIYALANRLGLDLLPPSASDHEQMEHIAEQLGLDYDGSSAAEDDILNSLYDMEAEENDPNDNGYDEDTVESYDEYQDGQDSSQKNQKKDKKTEEEQTDGESTDGKGEGSSDKKGSDGKQGQDGQDGQEKGPNDNGYDPNKKPEDTKDGTPKPTDAPEGDGSSANQSNNLNNKNNVNNNSQGDGGPKNELTKPGETNPNNNVNKNGSRPDMSDNGYKGTKATSADKQVSGMGNRNYQHNQRIEQGKKAEAAKNATSKTSTPKTSKPVKGGTDKKGGLPKKTGLPKKSAAAKQAQRIRNRQRVKRLQQALMKLWGFILKNPVVAFVILLVLLFIIIIIVIVSDDSITGGNGRGRRTCTYNVSGVAGTGKVQLSDLKVEVINCDGSASNGYEVLTTVDFEKYVLGVALAEAGESSPDEAIKAQIIAVRNFTLTRNQGMCPSHPEDCFHGYNQNDNIIRMRACTNDQVYWDYTKDCPKIERGGRPTLYCEGVDGSNDIWKHALSEQRIKEVEALANEVMGEVLLDEEGNVMKLGYMAPETDQFIEGAKAGKTYDQLLEQVYGSSDLSTATCSHSGIIDYGDYTLSSDGHQILHQPLDQFLESQGTSLEEFNELIADNVEDAGYGTRAGVVAAAVTLIGELGDNYGVKVPYYWGGGHYDGVIVGAHHYWGSDPDCTTYANNQTYDYCGLDCSGFVPWAIKNGGFNMSQKLAGDFQYISGAQKVTLRSGEPVLEPGDLLESSGHIVLVVGIDEEKRQYICAEASGNSAGVLFTRRSYKDSGYWGVKMDNYYANPSNIRSNG